MSNNASIKTDEQQQRKILGYLNYLAFDDKDPHLVRFGRIQETLATYHAGHDPLTMLRDGEEDRS